MREYLDWDIRETGKCGAEILLNTEVTEDLIEKENPDAIIVATGSVYVQPPIPGIENALSVRAVDAHEVETGENVVVCGGGITGLECALHWQREQKCHCCGPAEAGRFYYGNADFLTKWICWIQTGESECSTYWWTADSGGKGWD